MASPSSASAGRASAPKRVRVSVASSSPATASSALRQRPRRLEYGPASPSKGLRQHRRRHPPRLSRHRASNSAVPPRRVRISPQGIPYRQLLLHAHPHHRRAPLRALQHLQYRSWFVFLYICTCDLFKNLLWCTMKFLLSLLLHTQHLLTGDPQLFVWL